MEWCVLSQEERRKRSLPTTYAGMADFLGVTERTIHRWKNEPEHKAWVKQQKIARLANKERVSRPERPLNDPMDFTEEDIEDDGIGLPRATEEEASLRRFEAMKDVLLDEVEKVEPSFEDDRLLSDYQKVRRRVVEAATRESPDPRHVAVFMQNWGNKLLEAENEDPYDMSDLSDEDLIDEFVRHVGQNEIAAALGRFSMKD